MDFKVWQDGSFSRDGRVSRIVILNHGIFLALAANKTPKDSCALLTIRASSCFLANHYPAL